MVLNYLLNMDMELNIKCPKTWKRGECIYLFIYERNLDLINHHILFIFFSARWKKLDPLNMFNPGIGKTSNLPRYGEEKK